MITVKKVIFSLLVLSGTFALPLAVRAQLTPPEPVDYTEQVAVEGAGQSVLYIHALTWAQQQFSYAPTSGLVADPATGTVRLTGSGTLKPVNARGQDQTLPIQFTFQFQATDHGYTYHVSSFQVMPDPKSPAQLVPFEQHRAELQTDRLNEKTHNDRRLTAQANSLASEVAMSFRSFMNSRPAEDYMGVAGEQPQAGQ